MQDRITTACPKCSARLTASVSAVGRSLLCPRCQAAIPVREPTAPRLPQNNSPVEVRDEMPENEQRLVPDGDRSGLSPCSSAMRHHAPKYRRMFIITPVIGLLGALFAVSCILKVSEAKRTAQNKATMEKALIDKDFDLVLKLEPSHAGALIGRIQQQLSPPAINIEGAVEDLETLRKIAPEHPLHSEIQPALLVAEAIENARRGKIDEAFESMDKARETGVKELQLTVARKALIDALAKQAQSHLRHQRYRAAIADCDKLVKLGGSAGDVTSTLKKASDAIFERATKLEQLEDAIADLETVCSIQNSSEIRDQLGALHFRRAKSAYSSGLLDIANQQFRKMLDHGYWDSATPEFAVELAETMVAAYAAEPVEKHRSRALDVVALLDKLPIEARSVTSIKLRLSVSLLSDVQSSHRDSNIDFAAQSMTLAPSHGLSLEPHRRLAVLLAQAYADRCISRLQKKEIKAGIEDFLAASALNELQWLAILHRLELAGIPVPDELKPRIAELTEFAEIDSIWSVIPANAEAFFVVRNIESFSDMSDLVAARMRVPQPSILKTLCRKSGISAGLRKDGTLGYVQLPINKVAAGDNRNTIWILPATDPVALMKPLRSARTKKKEIDISNLYTVDVNGSRGFMTSLKSYVLFAFEPDRDSLIAAAASQFNIRGQLYPFREWGADLDAYTVLTPRGLTSGIREFPIPDSTPILDAITSRVRMHLSSAGGLLAGVTESSVQLAIGLTIQREKGIAIRSRSWTKPDVDLEEFLSKSEGGRERSLNLLPNAPFLVAIGGPVSVRQCEALSSLAATMFPDQKHKPVVSLSRIQIGLLTPEALPEEENASVNKTVMEHLARLQRSLIIVAEVHDAMTSMADIKARFDANALALHGPAGVGIPATESIMIDGVPVLRIHSNRAVDVQPLPDPLVMSVAAPNRNTLVITFGDDAQVMRAMVPCRGGVSLAESLIVEEAVGLLPKTSSWILVADLKPVVYEIHQILGFRSRAWFEENLKGSGFHDHASIPVAIGLSWTQTELDLDLCIPNASLPMMKTVLSFF